ncbi:MAG: lamin tail domain-containing protein [Fibrobacterales bacterium]
MIKYIIILLIALNSAIVSCSSDGVATTTPDLKNEESIDSSENSITVNPTNNNNNNNNNDNDNTPITTQDLEFRIVNQNIQTFRVDSVTVVLSNVDLGTSLVGTGLISNDSVIALVPDVPTGSNYVMTLTLLNGPDTVASIKKTDVAAYDMGNKSSTTLENINFPSTVLINEVKAGVEDWIELVNLAPVSINLNGWTLNYKGYNTRTSYNTSQSFTLNDDIIIPKGGVIVIESGEGVNTSETIYINDNFMWTTSTSSNGNISNGGNGSIIIIDPDSQNTSVENVNQGAIEILNATGTSIDFLCWVNLPTGSMSPEKWNSSAIQEFTSNKSISRSSLIDSNTDKDWTLTEPTKWVQ